MCGVLCVVSMCVEDGDGDCGGDADGAHGELDVDGDPEVGEAPGPVEHRHLPRPPRVQVLAPRRRTGVIGVCKLLSVM